VVTALAHIHHVAQVQVRPWRTSDAIYYTQPNALVSLRRTVFIGGVPRPIKACALPLICASHDQ